MKEGKLKQLLHPMFFISIILGVTAPATAELKIGYILSERIRSEFEEFKEAESQLQLEYRKVQFEFDQRVQKLDSLKESKIFYIIGASGSGRTTLAAKLAALLADKTNQYFDNNKPWEEIKKDNNSLLAHEVCSVTLLMFKNISIFLSPILPNIFKESQGFLNLKNLSWADLDLDLSGHTINEYSPLITRIEKESISRIIEDSKE